LVWRRSPSAIKQVAEGKACGGESNVEMEMMTPEVNHPKI